MSSTAALSELLQSRSSSIEQMKQKASEANTSSIEQRTVSQAEIPDIIDQLIDNKMFRNRYKRLIREGHLAKLLYLADYAVTSGQVKKPSHWFAQSCSVKRWEGTIRWVVKMIDMAKKAALVADRLKSKTTRFIFKQINRGVNVEHMAALAAEAGRDSYRLFCWLCTKNGSAKSQKPVKQAGNGQKRGTKAPVTARQLAIART